MKEYVNNMRPDTCVLFFFCALTFSVVFTHPVCILISLTASVFMYISLIGKESLLGVLKFGIIMSVFSLVFTVLLIHKGATILFYLPWGNPFTLESVYYGLSVAFIMLCVIIWSALFSAAATTEKIMYIFGGKFPSIAMLLCITLRFVPAFIKKFDESIKYEMMISGKEKINFESFASVTSSVISYGLDSGSETAESMKSRGFGKGKRTHYLRREKKESDKSVHFVFVVFILLIIAFALFGGYSFDYFLHPRIFSYLSIPAYAALCVFYTLPTIFSVAEVRVWKK